MRLPYVLRQAAWTDMTCALLTSKVIGGRLTTVFIDDGLMRENEPETLTGGLNPTSNTLRLNVADEFFAALKGKTYPKRKEYPGTHSIRVLGRTVKESRLIHDTRNYRRRHFHRDERRGEDTTQHP